MFQEFPYTNFHELNLDWIVKIAKDFLDQYTHIQEVIQTGLDDLAESRETGLEELNQKTLDGLAELQEKYDTLNGLLQAWYETHSADIAGQLAAAIADFNAAAEAKSQALLDSWPSDYSELVTEYHEIKNNLLFEKEQREGSDNLIASFESTLNMFDPFTCFRGMLEDSGNVNSASYPKYRTTDFIPVTPGEKYTISTRSLNASTHQNIRKVAAFFDSSKEIIANSYETINNAWYLTVTVPEGASYMRCSSIPTEYHVQLEKGDSASAYSDYDPYITLQDKVRSKKMAGYDIDFFDLLGFVKDNFSKSANLFSPNNPTIIGNGSIYSADCANADDRRTSSSSTNCSFYIPVTPVTKYTISYVHTRVIYFDRYKNTLSVETISTTGANTIETPANCYYIGINSKTGELPTLMIVQGETLPGKYVSYKSVFTSIPEWLYTQLQILDVISLITDNTKSSINLFSANNRSIIGNGKIYGADCLNADDRSQATALGTCSFFIPVKGSTYYTISHTHTRIVFFDIYKNTISIQSISGTSVTVQTPANCFYMGVNSTKANLPVLMIVEGQTLPESYISGSDTWVGQVGEKIILTENRTSPISLINCDEFFIDGKGYILDLGTHLTATQGETYLEIPYVAPTNSYIYKVCVAKTLDPVYNSTLSIAYNTTLWANYSDETKDFKLLPVTSMEDLAINQNSFYYDGTKIYINIEETTDSFVLAEDNSNSVGLSIENSRGKIQNLTIQYSRGATCEVRVGSNCQFDNCHFRYSSTGSGILSKSKSVVVLNKCEAFKARLDGMDTGSDGYVSTMIQNDCHCHYCYDDGSSHHGGIFSINGGEYDHNHKGGISAPCYNSVGNITGAFIHDNDVNGIYAYNDEADGQGQPFIVSNCLFKGNGRNYKINYYDAIAYNNIYADVPENADDIQNGTLTEYHNHA